MAETRFHLSSPNISIELPIGRPVGNIQNLTLNISHSQQQIKNLYNSGIQGFVKGYTVNSATASRAIIDYETFFGDSGALLVYYEEAVRMNGLGLLNGIGGGNLLIKDIMGAIGNYTLSSGSAIDVRETVELFEKLALGQISISDFFASVEFNLVANGESGIWRMEGCVLQSRNIKIDVGDIIIMENIEIFGKRFIDLKTSPNLANLDLNPMFGENIF